MAYSELEKALIENDCQAVIDELAHWNEEERAKAWEQICLLRNIMSCRNDANALSAAAEMKMEALCLLYGEDVLEQIHYRIADAMELVQVGLTPTPYIPIDLIGNKMLQVRVARILVDRRPPWLSVWYQSLTQDLAWNMDYVLWVCLFHASMIPKPEEGSQVLQRLIERFPDSFDACPVEAKWTLRELPALRLSVMNVCEIGPSLAGRWTPAAKWLSKNDLIDRTQAVQNALKILTKTKKQADRRSLMRFVRAIDATSLELQSLQTDLTGLLGDNSKEPNEEVSRPLASSPKPWASPKELQRVLKDLTSASAGRLERIKTAFDQGLLKDDRVREALLGSMDDRNIELANFIAEHVLPTLEPSVLPDLKSKLNLKGKLSHARRLRLIYKLAPLEGRPLVRQAIEKGSVEVKTAAFTCLEDNDEDWPLLLQAFHSDNDDFRVAARRTLCGMHSQRAIELQLVVLDSQDLLFALDSFLQYPVPAVVFKARQIVREKISELVDSANGEYRNLTNPQLVAHLQIAASIKDDDAAELLIECLRAANTMSKHRTFVCDLESFALGFLSSEFELGLGILIQNRDEISVSFLGELFRIARSHLEPAALFDAFSGYLRESDASGDSRQYKSFRSILDAISKRNGTTIGDYQDCLQRNRDLDPRWLDVALEQSLHQAILSLLVPGHLDTWNYLLERAESEPMLDVESRNPDTVIGLLLSEYPGAGEICMSALRMAYLKDSYIAQSWLHLASLLSTDECEELEAMWQDSLCPKVNQEIISLAIQEIGKRNNRLEE